MKKYKHRQTGVIATHFPSGTTQGEHYRCDNSIVIPVNFVENTTDWELMAMLVQLEWQIESFWYDKMKALRHTDGTYSLSTYMGTEMQSIKGGGSSQRDMLGGGWKIHSVKRLNDDVVFTVGDRTKHGIIAKIETYGVNDIWIHADGEARTLTIATPAPLTKLFTTEDGLPVYPGQGYYCFNTKLKTSWYSIAQQNTKLNKGVLAFSNAVDLETYMKAEKFLFKTEDGVDIYEDNLVWVLNVNILTQPWSDYNPKKTIELVKRFNEGKADHLKFYSTKEAAEEYLIMNKPCLSINDVMNKYGTTTYSIARLSALVKSKL